MKIFLIKVILLAGLFFFGGINLLLFLILSFIEMIESYNTKFCNFLEYVLEKYERRT